MKKKIIVFLFVLFLTMMSYANKNEVIEPTISNSDKVVSLSIENDTHNIELEEYLIGVVACEMPASFHTESLKALAVAARTYATNKLYHNSNYKLDSSTKDQCYIDITDMKSKWKDDYQKYYDKIIFSVEQTKNEIMIYNEEPILALYFSISNGYTENVENVFSEKKDYLVSTKSSWDSKYNYKEETVEYSYDEFYKLLNIDSIKESDINITRTNTSRVDTITIKDKTYKGTEFRKLLNLRSTDFEIDLSDNVLIKTKGYGHGVGMSQYGANSMAHEGYKYDEILKYYYKDIKIVNNY